MLVNKGKPFIDLLEHHDVHDLMNGLLGNGYLLTSYAVHVTYPGVPARPTCHTDQWFVPRAYPRSQPHRPAGNVRRGEFSTDDGEVHKLIAPPVVANVLWMLDDYGEDTGGTRLLPSSHLSGEEPDPDRGIPPGSITVTGTAGSAVVFDGRIWHGAGVNRTDGPRFGLFTTYCAGMFRPLENYVLGTSPEVIASASPHVLERLGFLPWQTYGRIGENVADFVSYDRDYVGELWD
jgi:Protein involved in biosynthesis of mitomycin antibiotics/polyketide fumonisin